MAKNELLWQNAYKWFLKLCAVSHINARSANVVQRCTSLQHLHLSHKFLSEVITRPGSTGITQLARLKLMGPHRWELTLVKLNTKWDLPVTVLMCCLPPGRWPTRSNTHSYMSADKGTHKQRWCGMTGPFSNPSGGRKSTRKRRFDQHIKKAKETESRSCMGLALLTDLMPCKLNQRL